MVVETGVTVESPPLKSPSELLSIYTGSKRVQRAELETQYRYLRAVKRFLKFTEGDLSEESITKFLHHIEDEVSPTHARWVYPVLKGAYEEWDQKWKLHPKDLPYGGKPSRPYLETHEAEQLLSLARNDLLDSAMFRLVMITGIRKRELIDINMGDFHPPVINIITRKHGEDRVRTLDQETVEVINRYVNGPRKVWDRKWKGRGDSPLFLSHTGIRFPASSLTKYFRRYMDVLGKTGSIGMHSLRRTVVTWESLAGMDTMRIQKLHGWKSPAMVEIYSRLKPEVLEKEAYAGNPLIKKVIP